MRADAQSYALAAATPVQIRGGTYALVAAGGTGNLQMAAPDGTFVNVSPAVIPPTAIALAAAGSISPIYLPAGRVQLASGTGWLIGIG
jgi:hypothetical protein